MTVVAIQGEAGSFSHDAALAWFGPGVELRTCMTFPLVFAALAEGRASRAVVPVENTVVGPIHEVVALLARARLRRVGETRVAVNLCLIVAGNPSEDRIRRIASHPVALAQCHRFLRARPHWETIETPDTAGAVRALAEGRLAADAVIASRTAAEYYGCCVIRQTIQDDVDNFTSFAVLEAVSRGETVGAPAMSPPEKPARG